MAPPQGFALLNNPAFGFDTHVSDGPMLHRRPALPLPFYKHRDRNTKLPLGSRILEVVAHHLMSYAHDFQKSLSYWVSLKMAPRSHCYFMVFERGPKAFINEAWKSFTRLIALENSTLPGSADEFISNNISALSALHALMCTCLGTIYNESAIRKAEFNGTEQMSLNAMFAILNKAFNVLDRDALDNQLFDTPLHFTPLPEMDMKSSSWKECANNGISIVYQNVVLLDSVLASRANNHSIPTTMTRHWLPYTCGAIGLSACCVWLSRNMETADFCNFMSASQEILAQIWTERFKKPALSASDEIFHKSRRNRVSVGEKEFSDSKESLRRLLVAYCEQSSEVPFPGALSDEKMMEIVTSSFEESSRRSPLQLLWGKGSIGHALAIKIQKERVDVKEMLVAALSALDSNGLLIAFLSALPAMGVLYCILLLVRKFRRLEHDDMILVQKMLVNEILGSCVLWSAMGFFEVCNKDSDQGSNEVQVSQREPRKEFGSLLCALDRLYDIVQFPGIHGYKTDLVRNILFMVADPACDDHTRMALLRGVKETYDLF